MYLCSVTKRYVMLNINSFKDAFVKLLLVGLVGFIFLTTTVALGNVVFGVLSSAFYIYEVARI